ncbi:endoglucanase [Pseudoclavibacter sp. CFCC 11306]|nr:endoglucanase [Pseudoclavibacter sp. CFCC 11306]
MRVFDQVCGVDSQRCSCQTPMQSDAAVRRPGMPSNRKTGKGRRQSVLSAAAGVMAVAVMAMGCAASPKGAPAERGQSETAPTSARHDLTWGVFLPHDGQESSDYAHVTEAAGDTPDYLMRFAALDDPVPVDGIRADLATGATPVVALEPWQPGAGVDQPSYALRTLAAGDHDVALHRWAQALAAVEAPIILRFGHEMNANWYPWAVGVNGNTAEEYVRVWHRLDRILAEHRADNVQMLWSPNVKVSGVTTPISDTFPGAETVDLIGVSGYNWGDGEGHHWTEPAELFGASLDELRALETTAPLLISETGSAEDTSATRRKAAWIDSLMRLSARQERLLGIIWFQMDKERDWRIDSSPESAAAFRQALSELA